MDIPSFVAWIVLGLAGVLVVHELGHALMALALGAGDVRLRINVLALAAHVEATLASPRRVMAFFLAGPAASLVFAAALVHVGGIGSLVGALSGVFGCMTLFPVGSNDGAKALAEWRADRRGTN